MESINSIKVIANKGIVNDRYFKENIDKKNQIKQIEIENVDYYNKISGTNFIPTDFIFPPSSAETFMGLFATTIPLIFLYLALFLMHAQNL